MYICRLVRGTQSIDLQYNVGAGYSLLNRGIAPSRPERVSLYGGRLQLELVRQEDGKRMIPLKLVVEGSDGQDLIERVNALEKMLRDAALYRYGGWGDECFLEFSIEDALHAVRFPVCEGEIDTDGLYEKCGGEAQDMISELPVWLTCEPLWEADTTYRLENYVDNPAFWRGATAPGDSWTESDPAGNLTLLWETSIARIQFMGRSLGWTIGPDGANNLGIKSDSIAVTPLTQYYVEGRGYHTGGCDRIYFMVYDVTHSSPIGAGLFWDNQDNAWEKLGWSFITPMGCTLVRIEVWRRTVDSTANNKFFYCDAFYLWPGTVAPTGWCSGKNLFNHMDANADHLNVLCVAEIPGEVEAEVNLRVRAIQEQGELHVAKRTRENPHNYLWQLVPCEAYTTAETGGGGGCQPGLTNGICIDSDKIGDATSPSGSRIQVSFATRKPWEHRCFWDIKLNEQDYHGDFVLAVICKASGTTDAIRMRVALWDGWVGGVWTQGDVITQTVPVPTTKQWEVLDGWEVFHYRIGAYDKQWPGGTSDRLYVVLRATTNAPGAPTDLLHIAGAYIIPVSESYGVTGMPLYYPPAGTYWNVKEMDGSRGLFTEAPGLYMHSSLGVVGDFPLLKPQVENYLYFFYTRAGELTITDTLAASVQYRPRGVFLRGANP